MTVLTLAAVLLVPMGAFAVVAIRIGSASLREQATANSETAVELGRRGIEAHLNGLARYVESYARRLRLSASLGVGDGAGIRPHLQDLVGGNPQLGRAFVTDPAGRVWSDWPADASVHGRSFARHDWYRGVSSTGKTYLSEAYLRAARPQVLVTAIATPVRGEDGSVAAYLVAQVALEDLSDWIRRLPLAREGSLLLLDQRGTLVSGAEGGEREPRPHGPLLAAAPSGDPEPRIPLDLLAGEESILSERPVSPFGWRVVARQPMRVVLEPVRALQAGIAAMAALLLALLVALGLSWFDAMRRAHVDLLRLQEAKDHLTGALIHDFRNPLTALLGNLDVAEERFGTARHPAAEQIAAARVSALRLVEMSSSVVDVMRMEDGKMPLALSRIDLVEILRAKAAEYEARARSQSLALRLSTPSHAVPALGDAAVLTRVVENLLTNAIKHTPPSGVVTLALEERPREKSLVIRVEDSGEGIPKEHLARLFTKYGRVEGQSRQTQYDTGLGLVFCRMAVELHGGTIRADSEVGRGTIFTIEIPAPPAPEAPAA